MDLDLFGPTLGAGGVTARPSETRSFTATDTFFKDCSSLDADDGTEFDAAWFNQVLGVLRSLARGNGKSGGGVDIITQDNADDLILLKSVQQLIQRNQPKFALDSGTANHVVVALSPAPIEYKNGMIVEAIVANPNTGPTDINVNGLGVIPVVRPDGTPVQQGDLLGGQFQAFGIYNGKAQLVWSQKMPGAPIYLQASRDFYVANTGSDANDGSSGAPWATLQKAANYITRFNLNGFNINVHVADGTYAGVSLPAMAGSGSVNWIGNHGAPGNCIIAGNGVSAIAAQNCGRAHTFDGFRLSTSGTYTGDPMCGANVAGAGTAVLLTNIDWGVCSGYHLAVTQAAVVTYAGNMIASGPSQGANPQATQGWHCYCGDGGIVQVPSLSNVTLTIPSPITMGNGGGWVEVFYNGFSQIVYGSITGGGNVTGQKFRVQNAICSVAGNGDNHYPGNIPGVRAPSTNGYAVYE
ncbi:hypothetical protein [Bradyrhizobium sp. SZCCHNR2012]|uniref:hypothetical protein n=1 Tax=Bradyrhizobium sp. SZCCHNR2012 TaxID=3057377 RepID=UPI0028EB8628|nr:hypothetical protein [Bradyrhizobium sp. SZCCHNR2012]